MCAAVNGQPSRGTAVIIEVLKQQTADDFSTARRPLISRVRFQLSGGILCAVLPVAIRSQFSLDFALRESLNHASLGAVIAIVLGYYLIRRIGFFPGVQMGAQILFAISASFALVALALFLLHLHYSRFVFATSYCLALGWFIGVHLILQRRVRPQLALVPGGNANGLMDLPGAQWRILATPPKDLGNLSAVVADLRHDLSDEWERFIADCTLRGLPVFHTKQVQESLTGKVEIEHLSENTFGSLLPSLTYLKIKHAIDWVTALILLPLFLVAFLLVAPLIMLESSGPVFYRQRRVGYRGLPFTVYKFRTMRSHEPGKGGADDRDAAITQDDDERVTRVGRYLRRYRIDELPQILNILKGEMSWIGPRPEAASLADWYEAELPFYRYRHVVRPGITGWAQVNQGHVAHPQEVLEKLHFDFFYIKRLSPWLDLLIAIRTVMTILRGFGAK